MTSPILVFAKAPVPGRVKTRLTPGLTTEKAAQIHKELVHHTLHTLHEFPVQLWCTPDCQHPFFIHCAQRYPLTLHTQSRGDLGEKMGQALAQTLHTRPYAILIGSDCPALTAGHIRQANHALKNGDDAVVSPTEDGGFCLIGLRQYRPQLFEGITWGSAQAFARLERNLSRLGWHYSLLPTLWDIDRPEDYLRYCKEF